MGFSPRGHSYSPDVGYKYRYNQYTSHSITCILTNIAFLHRQYVRMFENHMPQSATRLIDELQNCEDIAMNFLVASYCRCTFAAFVKPREKQIHYGLKSGISTKSNHTNERNLCVKTFASSFPTLPKESTMVFQEAKISAVLKNKYGICILR